MPHRRRGSRDGAPSSRAPLCAVLSRGAGALGHVSAGCCRRAGALWPRRRRRRERVCSAASSSSLARGQTSRTTTLGGPKRGAYRADVRAAVPAHMGPVCMCPFSRVRVRRLVLCGKRGWEGSENWPTSSPPWNHVTNHVRFRDLH